MGVLPRQLEGFYIDLAMSMWTAPLAERHAGEIWSGEEKKTFAPILSAGIIPVLSKLPLQPQPPLPHLAHDRGCDQKT